MSSNKMKRINTVLKQLETIHLELFGQKYSIGLTLDEKSEFNRIIDELRQLLFVIRTAQEERQKKQNQKSYKKTPQKQMIGRNQQIRMNIEKAESMCKQAARRLQNGQNIDRKIIQNRQKNLKNCYDLLEDVKQCEQGGVYKPPTYPTIQQMKKNLLQDRHFSEADSQVNMEQQLAFDQFNNKDKKMDGILDQIIDVNRNVKNKMKDANSALDQIGQKTKKANKKADKLITRVEKADKDLAEILKTYQRPSQLCLNVTLILMVLALVGVIISLIKGSTV